MKTIEVTDEMYNSLMELSKEMVSQDPLGTKMPHMFQIQTNEEIVTNDWCGTEIWVNSEGDELRTEDDIREYITQYIYDGNDNGFDLSSLGDKESMKLATKTVNEMNEYDLHHYLENEVDYDWRTVNVTTEHKYQNTFFTAKACKEHIEQNDYHYREPKCYLNHAWRNPEMELVSKFLCELSGGKLHE
jgi:hypothetical protein